MKLNLKLIFPILLIASSFLSYEAIPFQNRFTGKPGLFPTGQAKKSFAIPQEMVEQLKKIFESTLNQTGFNFNNFNMSSLHNIDLNRLKENLNQKFNFSMFKKRSTAEPENLRNKRGLLDLNELSDNLQRPNKRIPSKIIKPSIPPIQGNQDDDEINDAIYI